MVSYNYIDRKVQLHLGGKEIVYGTIVGVDEIGFTIMITECYGAFYREKETYFISHSTPMSMRFVED